MSGEASPGFRDSPIAAVQRGEVVGTSYAIRDEIVRCDSGIVFEARDMMIDRLVALKLAWCDPGLPSLILEARYTASVRDPAAVAIYGMGNHRGLEFVVGERVTGTLLRELLEQPLPTDIYLTKLRTLVAAVAHAHEAGIGIGDLSGATILVDKTGRMVLGRLSLSQVPVIGSLGQIVAPEIIRAEVDPRDPAGAQAIDLYGLGCLAIEMARGAPPFADDDRARELLGHAHDPPPRLADLRTDVPVELSDLVEWLLAKDPAARPRSARDTLDQLESIIDRLGTRSRAVRVLIVDDDSARGRWLWSLARRAYPAAQVEIASEGTDAAHKLNRDCPDLVFVDSTLRGVMNALELCMYARGLETEQRIELVLIGEVSERDRALFASTSVPFIPEDAGLATAVLERVRTAAAEPPRRRKARTTVSG